jgi:hypothetical protein
MKVKLVLVPPGGGEMEHSMDMDLHAIPGHGDYIRVSREGAAGSEDFIVRRVWWILNYPASDPVAIDAPGEIGHIARINVECEYAIGGNPSESHKKRCEFFRLEGKPPKEFEDSGY